MLKRTGGSYSHNGMIDCPRFPISELHLGNFLGSMEFQRWKVNFKTQVCSKTAADADFGQTDFGQTDLGQSDFGQTDFAQKFLTDFGQP